MVYFGPFNLIKIYKVEKFTMVHDTNCEGRNFTSVFLVLMFSSQIEMTIFTIFPS